jgi:hypothetical protein
MVTLNFGVRYDYYTPIRERNDLQVKFNVDTGVIDPPTTPVMRSRARSTPDGCSKAAPCRTSGSCRESQITRPVRTG